jgi:hypothetical protein
MSSSNLATVAVSELVEPAERAVHDLHPQLVDVAARGLRVGKDTQVTVLDFQRHGRHLHSAKFPGKVWTSINMVVSFMRTFISEVISLGLFSGRGSMSVVLLMLAVLTTLYTGDPSPTPTPTPTPIPF